MKAKVIGFSVSKSKREVIGTTAFLEVEHDNYRKETALKCVGNACIQEYIRGDYSDVLQPQSIVELVYGKGYQDKAVLEEIIPRSEK